MQPTIGVLNRVAHGVYGSRLDDVLRRSGLRGALYRAYQHVLGRLHPDDTMWLECGDTGAAFYTVHNSELLSLLHTWRKERAVIEDVVAELHTDDCVWDIGANLGLYTCLANRVTDAVRGFEPYPPSAARAAENISLNGGTAVIDERALWDERGRATLDVERAEIGTQTPAVRAASGGVTIERVIGDGLVESIGAPTVLKVDVEGAEEHVLDGLGHVLSSSVRLAYVEVHDNAHVVRERLTDAGLDVSVLPVRGEQCCLKGVRTRV